MKWIRRVCQALVAVVLLAALGAGVWAPASYETQFRETPLAEPSETFPLGTDGLGRDRLSRLAYGTRVSLLLAPAAAVLTTLLAALLGGLAGFSGGWIARAVLASADLFLSLPWLFLLLAIRALLPLDVTPAVSVGTTFAILGILGWAGPGRLVYATARQIAGSDTIQQALATGATRARVLWVHLLPNLRPVLRAQFWAAIPLFILSEANLGILGLGIAEPLPSWGSLLRELEDYTLIANQPVVLASALIMVAVVASIYVGFESKEAAA